MKTIPETLEYRLRERARIRRQIPGRKSVEEGKPDRIADLLEEAANKIAEFENGVKRPIADDRIKELAKQSGLIAPHASDHEGLANFDYRQFAKLIIEECSSK